MLIRPCTPSDLQRLEQAWPSHGVHAAHLRRQDSREATYLVAWREDEPIGAAMVLWGGPHGEAAGAAYPGVVEVAHLQVREEHRGAGAGTALMHAAEDLARERGHRRVAVGVGTDNPDAARLYERLGYRRTGVLDTTTYSYVGEDGAERTATEEDELMVKEFPDGGVRAQLEAKEAELLEEMAQLTRPQQDQGSISFGKRVGDGTAMAVDRLTAVEAHDTLGALLEEVRHAIARIDAGGYGRCEECGEPIPEGRLEARPWATRCVRHS